MKLDVIFKLRPVKWQYKNDIEKYGEKDAPWQRGLIAEEVEALGLKRFVAYSEESEVEGLYYSDLLKSVIASLRKAGYNDGQILADLLVGLRENKDK